MNEGERERKQNKSETILQNTNPTHWKNMDYISAYMERASGYPSAAVLDRAPSSPGRHLVAGTTGKAPESADSAETNHITWLPILLHKQHHQQVMLGTEFMMFTNIVHIVYIYI